MPPAPGAGKPALGSPADELIGIDMTAWQWGHLACFPALSSGTRSNLEQAVQRNSMGMEYSANVSADVLATAYQTRRLGISRRVGLVGVRCRGENVVPIIAADGDH
jgi:hypothetical protein